MSMSFWHKLLFLIPVSLQPDAADLNLKVLLYYIKGLHN